MLRDPLTRFDRGLGRFDKLFDIVEVDGECLFLPLRLRIKLGGLP
jgi:hypothetical protein